MMMMGRRGMQALSLPVPRCFLRGPAALRPAAAAASLHSGCRGSRRDGCAAACLVPRRHRINTNTWSAQRGYATRARGKGRRGGGNSSSNNSNTSNKGGLFSDQGATYYDILGVGKKANANEIRAAYLKLAAKHHPDRSSGDVRLFKQANQAYQTLRDPSKKRSYDLKLDMEEKGEEVEDWEQQHDMHFDPKVNVEEGLLLFGDAFSVNIPPALGKLLAHVGVPQLGSHYRSYGLELLALLTALVLGKQAHSTYRDWKSLDLEQMREAEAAAAAVIAPPSSTTIEASSTMVDGIPDLEDDARQRFIAGVSGLALFSPAFTFYRRKHLSLKLLPFHLAISGLIGSLLVRFVSGPLVGLIEPIHSSPVWDTLLLNANSAMQATGTTVGASAGVAWAMRHAKVPSRALVPGVLAGVVAGRVVAWFLTRPVTGIWWDQPEYKLRLLALASEETLGIGDVKALEASLETHQADLAASLAALEEAKASADGHARKVARTKLLLQRAQQAKEEERGADTAEDTVDEEKPEAASSTKE